MDIDPPPPQPPPPPPKQARKQEETTYRNWVELPQDVTALILKKVDAIDVLCSAQYVCSSWRSICKDRSMWRSINIYPKGQIWESRFNLEAVCRNAVDRSCGGLISITILNIATDELIKYIADRSSHLKQLRLLCCLPLTDYPFSEAAKKFPLLEELEISYCPLSSIAIEGIGKSCPLLRSLKLNCQGYKRRDICRNKEALAIANTMPHLRYLQLFGNRLTDIGVQAILNSCKHFEYLDLRQCFNVDLEGQLGVFAERIKDLRMPYDSTDDYPYNPEMPDPYYSSSGEEDDPSGFPDVDFMSDDDGYYEFSGGEISDLYFD